MFCALIAAARPLSVLSVLSTVTVTGAIASHCDLKGAAGDGRGAGGHGVGVIGSRRGQGVHYDRVRSRLRRGIGAGSQDVRIGRGGGKGVEAPLVSVRA